MAESAQSDPQKAIAEPTQRAPEKANAEPAQPGPQDAAAEPTQPNQVRKIAVIVLGLIVVLFVYGVVADRASPYTSQATVQAFVVGIAPEVPGRVIEVAVQDNQFAKGGDLLFRIDPASYEIALRQAEARLAGVSQTIGANTAGVASAQARLVEAKARLENVREQTGRVFTLVKSGVYAQARGDQAKAQLDASQAEVSQAEAELERARQNLGPEGAENPQLREALSALEQAKLNLLRTSVFAPADGLVTNLTLTVGHYAATGQPALTFIDINTIWVAAAFRENSLEHMIAGSRAEVVFDVLPGRVFAAKVQSVGWGVAQQSGESSSRGGLPTIKNQSGWIREPQRLWVRLELLTARPPRGVKMGSQVNVIVYASDDVITRSLGWFWIRVVAVLTFLS
jgi:multidrug resistance efflux pump